MAAHEFGRKALDYTQSRGAEILDPGDGKQIPIDRGFGVCHLTVGAADETRLLPDPTVGTSGMGAGTQITLVLSVTTGGGCTVEGATLTMAGDVVVFTVYEISGVKTWKQASASSAASVTGVTMIPAASFNAAEPDNTEYYKPATGQVIIPRYGDGQTHPAGVLQGYGPRSVIAGNINTMTVGSLVSQTRAVVITEDVDQLVSKWQRGDQALQGVLQPTMRDLTVVGYDVNADNYGTAGVVGSFVWTEEGQGGTTPEADLYHLCVLKGTGTIVDNVLLFYAPGDALYLAGGTGVHDGQEAPFDKEKFTIRKLTVRRAFAGLTVDVIDGVIGNVEMESIRSWGIRLLQGSVQFDGAVHIYGVGNNGSNYLDFGNANPTTHPGVCVWIASTAGGSWGGPFYVETARMGMKIDGIRNSFGPIYSRDCVYRHIEITGSQNRLHDVHLDMLDAITEVNGGAGIYISGRNTTIDGGHFRGSAAVEVPAGETCIEIAGDGGTFLRLHNIDIIGTNASTAPLISIKTTLQYSRIFAILDGGGDGIDLFTSSINRLGVNNFIIVTGAVSGSLVKLDPAGWDDISNNIYINGVRQRSSGTVTQLTSKSTGVTLAKSLGDITMHNALLNAGDEVTFTVTNSLVAAGDRIHVQHVSGGTAGAYLVQCTSVGSGSFGITVSNVSASNLSEAIVLRFDLLPP